MDFSQLSEDDKVLAVQLLKQYRKQQKNIAENFASVVSDWCDLDLTEAQHDALWKLVEPEMDEHHLQSLSYSSIGTDTRESIMSVISNALSGMDWPMYGDNDKYKEKFNAKMQEGLAKIGYTEPFTLD